MSRGMHGRGRGRARAAAAAAGLALAVPSALIMASPAHAATTPPWDCTPMVGDNYVVSCFSAADDDFWVYDAEPDGASAVVSWSTSYGASDVCRNAGGYGTWKQCDYDLVEGRTVYWDHYTYDADTGDVNYTSGGYQHTTGAIA